MEKYHVKEDDIHVLHGPAQTSPIPRQTVGMEMYERLLKVPEGSVAMIDAFSGEKLLYSELLQKAINLAESLKIQGYGQNTMLAICSENSLQFYVPVLASLFNGSVIAPLNHGYQQLELRHILNITNPKVIFCSQAVSQKFIQLKRQKLYHIERIIILDDLIESPIHLQGCVESMDKFIDSSLNGMNIHIRKFKPTEGDIEKMPAFILCSSGTTGLPKGVILSHLNVMIAILQSRDPLYAVPDKDDKVLGLLPFFHAFGLTVFLAAISNAQTIICLKKFNEDTFLGSIQDFKIRVLILVPSLAIFLTKTEKIYSYDLKSIEELYCGAAPLSAKTEEKLKKRLKCKFIRQAYGSTETLTVLIVERDIYKPGSCGKVVRHMSGKVRDVKTGKSLGPNQIGELCWKGPLVMMGYYKNVQANRDTFTSDGWLKSGDLGYYDEEGFFYVIDRLKEIIKYKGYQVAPAEIEGLLISHPKIEDAGVVGLPDEFVGEKPVAFVVKEKGTDVTDEEIQRYVADNLSPQKRLSGGVIFVDSIPRNPSGKILRKELRKTLQKYGTSMETKSKL